MYGGEIQNDEVQGMLMFSRVRETAPKAGVNVKSVNSPFLGTIAGREGGMEKLAG
jgi:hypothetical protein